MNFEMEVTNILESRPYELTDEKKDPSNQKLVGSGRSTAYTDIDL